MEPQANILTFSNRHVIDVTKPWHLAWWAKRFDVSEQRLQDAVALVGERADLVRRYLNRQEPRGAIDYGQAHRVES